MATEIWGSSVNVEKMSFFATEIWDGSQVLIGADHIPSQSVHYHSVASRVTSLYRYCRACVWGSDLNLVSGIQH